MVTLKNRAGRLVECPTGFSWTALFFGPLVPLFRGWLPMVPVYLGGTFLSLGIFALVLPFEINRYYVAYLLDRNYAPATPKDAEAIKAMGLPDESLPKWISVHTFMRGDRAPYGLYVALNKLDYLFVSDDNSPLEAADGVEYMRLPMFVALMMIPCLALVFYFAFPVIVIGFVSYAAFKFVVRPTYSFVARSTHLAEITWNPIMAYMKTPPKKQKKKETVEPTDKTKKD